MKIAFYFFLALTWLSCYPTNSETVEEKAKRIKNNLVNLLKCETCSVGLQSITYLDSLNQSHTVNAYAVLDNNSLIYFTANDFRTVSKDQVTSYRDIKLLRYKGHAPKD